MNLEEEVLWGHLVTAETKKLWAVEMDIAQKILDVCKKYNLKIWADGGTLLGTVRHQGFIPWDDDMDFVMFRDDYNKLVEVGPKEFAEPYFFQSFHTDTMWGGMIKVRRSDTAMIDENYYYQNPRNMGIFVDVLVLDAIPDDKDSFYKEYDKVSLYRRLLHRYRIYNWKFNTSLRMKLTYIVVCGYFMFHSCTGIQNRIKDILSSHKISENKNVGLIDFFALECLGADKIDQRDKHWYDETIELPFHDMMIPVPKEYHKVLTENFGDYMIPVKGLNYHSMVKCDCDRSYVEVLKELKNCKHNIE